MAYTITQAQAGRGTVFSIGPVIGTAEQTFTQVQEVRSDPWEQHWDTEDVSNFNSEADKEFIALLRDNGRIPIHANRVSVDEGQQQLIAAWNTGDRYYFRLELPHREDQPTMGDRYTFAAIVESLEIEFDAEKSITYTGALKVTGEVLTIEGLDGSLGLGNATGSVAQWSSRSLGTTEWSVNWSDFNVVTLPSDAVITAIYPVLVASANHDRAFQYYRYGTTITGLNNVSGGNGFSLPSHPESTTFSTSLWYDNSIGTSLGALAGQQIQVSLQQSLVFNDMLDTITVSAVGFAVYYTSAAALVDPLIPPPVSVPAGHGLAWALPFSVAFSPTVGAPHLSSGIFGTGMGTATGTAAAPTLP